MIQWAVMSREIQGDEKNGRGCLFGNIHSIQTFATADGPGSRFVVFMQGCRFRCVYCHNPDTWRFDGGTKFSAEQIVKKMLRYTPYYGNNGGITLSGGEPLLQAEFAAEVFYLCRQNSVHTALDTAGSRLDATVKKLLQYTDLVLLDIKHCEKQKFRQITGCRLDTTLDFLDYLTETNKKFWVRQVVADGINDTEAEIELLAKLLQGRKSLERVELLPYHTLGAHKWQSLGIDYPLKASPPISQERIAELTSILERWNIPVS